jgi:purine-binding chemotaxis protein CheW
MTEKPENFQFGASQTSPIADVVNQSQFVTFAIADQRFAIDILSVREIRMWTGATRLPNARAHVRGVINLRGAIIPVIDLGTLFTVQRQTAEQNQVVVIVDINNALKGLLVDSVSDIIALPTEAIAALPHSETEVKTPLFSGLINDDQGLVAIIALHNLDLSIPAPTASETAAA